MNQQEHVAWVNAILKDFQDKKTYGTVLIEFRDGMIHLVERMESTKLTPPNSPIGAYAHGRKSEHR
jgi:hypothetical protein